jgi:predicted GH43/DUF377 family glycosyl hydrolase
VGGGSQSIRMGRGWSLMYHGFETRNDRNEGVEWQGRR